jgi:hypothetical protein
VVKRRTNAFQSQVHAGRSRVDVELQDALLIAMYKVISLMNRAADECIKRAGKEGRRVAAFGNRQQVCYQDCGDCLDRQQEREHPASYVATGNQRQLAQHLSEALACCHSWVDCCSFRCGPAERSGRCWQAAPFAVLGACWRYELPRGAGALSAAAASCGLAASLTDAAAG